MTMRVSTAILINECFPFFPGDLRIMLLTLRYCCPACRSSAVQRPPQFHLPTSHRFTLFLAFIRLYALNLVLKRPSKMCDGGRKDERQLRRAFEKETDDQKAVRHVHMIYTTSIHRQALPEVCTSREDVLWRT